VTDDRLDSRPFGKGQIANDVQELFHIGIIPRTDAFEISDPTSLQIMALPTSVCRANAIFTRSTGRNTSGKAQSAPRVHSYSNEQKLKRGEGGVECGG
jgi:hypothetical protein